MRANHLLSEIKKQVQKEYKENIKVFKKGFSLSLEKDCLYKIFFEFSADKIIWPAREGELIEDSNILPVNFAYSLSYPGTASTKSLVVFYKKRGVFIGGLPSKEYTKISIIRVGNKRVRLIFESNKHDYIFLPFNRDWREVIDDYRSFYNIKIRKTKVSHDPKFLLQIGVRKPNGRCFIKNYLDLKKPVDYFKSKVGTGHIMHFFGASKYGFDRIYPLYDMDPLKGGDKAMKELLYYIKKQRFLTSHHFNPRIADYDWVKKNPKYKAAIVTEESSRFLKTDKQTRGVPIIELYKGHPMYIMNPNHPLWFERCLKTIKYLYNLGFDYVQLDQFSYQRNFYSEGKPIQQGYLNLVREMEKQKINYWLEGVNELYHPKGANFSQILLREVPQFWSDMELRRGYPYGISHPDFYTSIYPNENLSYQVMTENKSVGNFQKKLKVARDIKAMVYDLQMAYYDESYMELLEDVTDKIVKYF